MIDIVQLLGKDVDNPLQHRYMTISSDQLYFPGHDYVDHVMIDSNRPPVVLCNMQTLYNTGCLADTGCLSILLVDQGIEHSVGAPSVANPLYFDSENTVELVTEAGCNCVTPAYGVLALIPRRYAHYTSFPVEPNYNETLSCPNIYDQTLYVSVEQTFNMGVVAVGVTIYFGSGKSRYQIEEISVAFECARELGMVAVLRVYLRNSAFKKDGIDYHISAGLTGQTNYLAVAIGAGIVEQKMAENNGDYRAVNCGYTNDRMYSKLTSENPIDLVRYQLVSCYMGQVGSINPGDVAGGEIDLSDAVCTTVTNKRVDGMGLTLERKASKKSMADGVKLTNVVRDAYLDGKTTIA